MKGANSTYRPKAGTRCLFSGPNMDDDNGYVFMEVEIMWEDGEFVVTQKDGCWPSVHKWDLVIAKPLPRKVMVEITVPEGVEGVLLNDQASLTPILFSPSNFGGSWLPIDEWIASLEGGE